MGVRRRPNQERKMPDGAAPYRLRIPKTTVDYGYIHARQLIEQEVYRDMNDPSFEEIHESGEWEIGNWSPDRLGFSRYLSDEEFRALYVLGHDDEDRESQAEQRSPLHVTVRRLYLVKEEVHV